jgi:hypothetical protein
MGKVIRAYRTHPHHGRSLITQVMVAAWAGVTQAQLSRIENGPPIMHMDKLAHWAKTLRIPGNMLWFDAGQDGEDASSALSTIGRSDFLKMSAAVVGGMTAGAAMLPGSGPTLTEQSCAQWFAWELWHQKRDYLHESEMPRPVATFLHHYTASVPGGMGFILRDAQATYRFAHSSFVDFFVAQRIFENITSGGGALFATAQTSHQMDLVICEFVANSEKSAGALRNWMTKASSPVLRVNSAGVLAKLGPVAEETDRVVASLKRDADARQLYLTAVTSRVLGMPWEEAKDFAASLESTTAEQVVLGLSRERAAEAIFRLRQEVSNVRDGGARWCSGILLGRLQVVAPELATPVLQGALRSEPNPENLRSIACILSGTDPISF